MTTRQAYTSTVVAPDHVALALLADVVLLSVLPDARAWPLALGASIAFPALGLHLATVRLCVSTDRILLGQGPWRRPARVIDAADILECSANSLGRAQIFGVGVPFHRRTTRLTVRPGPTLCLTVRGGEYVRVSTSDPAAAAQEILSTRSSPSACSPATDRNASSSPGSRRRRGVSSITRASVTRDRTASFGVQGVLQAFSQLGRAVW
jgi:hypothetical protein